MEKTKTAYIVNVEEAEKLRGLATELRKHGDDRLSMWIVYVCERNIQDYCEPKIVEK